MLIYPQKPGMSLLGWDIYGEIKAVQGGEILPHIKKAS